jgi:hypothetical protein
VTRAALPQATRIASEVREFYAKLTQAHPLSAADLRGDASQLGQVLLGPVSSQLGRKRLVIVPDGVLNYIPFSILGTMSEPHLHSHSLR